MGSPDPASANDIFHIMGSPDPAGDDFRLANPAGPGLARETSMFFKRGPAQPVRFSDFQNRPGPARRVRFVYPRWTRGAIEAL